MDEAINNSVKVGIYEYISFDNSLWIKIFYHNYYNLEVFDNEDEVLYSTKEHKYSIFREIKENHRINGKFEFILYYPELKTQYNHWRQTNSPHVESEYLDKPKAVGYEPIKIDWESQDWGGLNRNKLWGQKSSFIDGSVGQAGWFYAIGLLNNKTSYAVGKMPGPDYEVTEVYLWMRIEDFAKIMKNSNCVRNHSRYSVLIFIMHLFFSK